MSIGLLRSELRAATAVAKASSDTAASTPSRRATVPLAAWLWAMVGVYLRFELVMPGGEVRFQADAGQYRTRLGDGDALVGHRQVAVGEYVQLFGIELHLAFARGAGDLHRAVQAQLVPLRGHP